MLTIAFNFWSGDRDQGLAVAEQIRALNAAENHHCLMVYPQGTKHDDIEAVLRAAFHSVDKHEYAAQLSGWPQGPNEAFQEAAMRIASDPRCGDFLWFEMDIVLTSPNAFNFAESAYRHCGHPLLGNVVDTVQIDTRRVSGRHMIGVGIYPKEFAKHCPLVKYLARMSSEHVRQGAVPMAFDAYLGPYTFQRCSETPLIQHFWRSKLFHVEQNGEIVAGETVSPEKRVRTDALFIHGAKDDSLMKMFNKGAPAVAVANRTGKSLQEIDVMTVPLGAKVTVATEVHEFDTTDRKKEKALLDNIDTTLRPKEPVKTSTMEPPRTGSTSIDERKGKKMLPYPPEVWNRGEDGRPCPPFLYGQMEFRRWNQLMVERLKKDGLKKLKDYAKLNLKLHPGQVTAAALIDLCVLAERAAGKEEWTKSLPPPWFPSTSEPIPPETKVPPEPTPAPPVPAAPPASPAGWSSQAPDQVAEGGSLISESMKQKMINLRIKRGELAAAPQ